MVLRRRRWLSALPRSPGLCSPLPGVSGVVAGPAGRRGGIWGGVSPGAAPLPGPRTHRRLSLALPRGVALRVVVQAGGYPGLPSRVTTAAGLQDPEVLGAQELAEDTEVAPSLLEVACFPSKVVRGHFPSGPRPPLSCPAPAPVRHRDSLFPFANSLHRGVCDHH